METVLVNVVGPVRRERVNGREYIVAPMTLLRPQVLNGSEGPLYYPPEEIARRPDDWNGMPIVVDHPVDNGRHVSARRQDVVSRRKVGRVYSAAVEAGTGALQAEGWFSVDDLRRVDRRVLEALEAGGQVEVSTGLFTRNEPAPAGAAYNGRSYGHVARDYRPDHLAVLPDQKGACSVTDGCGVNVKNHTGQDINNHQGQDSSPANTGDGAMPLTQAERKAAVDYITANCKCWEDNDGQRVLNDLSDDRLLKIRDSTRRVDNVLTAVREKLGSPTANADEMPERVRKELGKTKEEAATKSDESGQAGGPGAGAPGQAGGGGAGATVAPGAQPTGNAWTGGTNQQAPRLTPEEMEDLAFARQERNRQKAEMVGRLTGNIQDAMARAAAAAVYNGMSLAQLAPLVNALPPPSTVQQAAAAGYHGNGLPGQPVPSYLGAGVLPPTGNSGGSGGAGQGDDEDILPLPTMNWAEEAKALSSAGRR